LAERRRARFVASKRFPTFRCRRVFDAPRALVFAAYTEPQHLTHWWGGEGDPTLSVCEVDLRVGGAWRFVFTTAAGEVVASFGKYIEIDPPRRLRFTIALRDAERLRPEGIVTIMFDEVVGGTSVSLTTEFPSMTDRAAWSPEGARGGSLRAMRQLSAYLDRVSPRRKASPGRTSPPGGRLPGRPVQVDLTDSLTARSPPVVGGQR
jgi:uncharacterized protein YndB with AHSA1/START domain